MTKNASGKIGKSHSDFFFATDLHGLSRILLIRVSPCSSVAKIIISEKKWILFTKGDIFDKIIQYLK
jgi:hypothetical protein